MQKSMSIEPQARAGILSLPLEAIEDIIVCLAVDDEFVSISSFSQTCRRFRQFIYDPLDKHLWRRVFLSTFDDPRDGGQSNPYDWGAETRQRICAAIRLKPGSTTSDPRVTTFRLRSEKRALGANDTGDFADYLRVLIDVVVTAKPVLYSATVSTSHSGSEGVTSLSLQEVPESSASAPLEEPNESKNLNWLCSVLGRGLLCELACRFGHSHLDKEWCNSAESQHLHHLLALFGRSPILNSPAPGQDSSFSRRWKSEDSFQWTQLNEKGRAGLARFISQTRVYNMAYPTPQRSYGPYLPVGSANDPDHLPIEAAGGQAPEILYPDWAHLAAIRITVEANMHDRGVSPAGLIVSDSLRRGAWVSLQPPEDDACPDNVGGWDWAGVEGVWRRCVCWLGYPHLMMHNTKNFQGASGIHEQMLIVPLKVHIVGYSPSTAPGYERYPTIRIEGEMGGSEWEGEHDIRRIHGTVGIIADGSVRWSVYSSAEGTPDEDEWLSEGVQMGGIGSSAGILGLWTGAHHEDGDPIGAWWQWRVM